MHGLLLDGQPLVDWERDALHREVGRTLHVLDGQDNADLPAIVHARQLDPMGRMLHQDWRGLRHAAAMPTTDNANDSIPALVRRRVASPRPWARSERSRSDATNTMRWAS